MPRGLELFASHSDASRRLALQLAVQLPSDVEEARAVVDDLAVLLERYIMRSPRPIWERQLIAAAPGALFLPAAIFWMVATLAIASLLAVTAHRLIGLVSAGGMIFALAVVFVGLVFGRGFGLASAVLAMLLTDLLITPPMLQLDSPSPLELVFAAGYAVCGALVPIVARYAEALRAGATISCAGCAPGSLPRSPD